MNGRSAINLTPGSDELGKAGLSLLSIVPPGELSDGWYALKKHQGWGKLLLAFIN